MKKEGSWSQISICRDAEYTAWAADPVTGQDYAYLDPAENFRWRAAEEAAQHRPVCQR
jgi:hypothetical protein